MSAPAEAEAHRAAETAAASSDDAEASTSEYECPFCVMMRKGGCETPFKAFMDCGEKADKGDQEMSQCVQYFEALHACMEKNKAVFDELLVDMKAEEGKARQQQQQQEQPQEHAATPSPAAAQAPATASTSSSREAGPSKAGAAQASAPTAAAAAVAAMAGGGQRAPAA